MTEEYATLVDIPVTRQQIENCTFSHWYPKLKKHTPKTEVIKPVPSEFIRYLEQDGIQLPEEKNVQFSICCLVTGMSTSVVYSSVMVG